MGGQTERVSVVLPTWNRAATLPRAIRSVLDQTHGALELIVVDDGSTDATREVVAALAEPRLRYLPFERNRGQAAARNAGIAASTADLVAFQDSDDIWMPEKLARQLEALRARPDLAGVYGDLRRHQADGQVFVIIAPDLAPGRYFDRRPSLYQTFGLGIQSCLLRRTALAAAGGFREDMRCYEDLELLLRLAREHRLQRIPLVLVDYIESATSVSKNGEEDRRARAMLLRLYGFRAAASRPKAFWRELKWSLGPSPVSGLRRFLRPREALG
ncbi:MAG: glycosyltransferase family 2 protein [Dongiaceae bacterium]